MNYTYILRCADGTFYTGWTNDLEKRLKAHNAGTGGKYTRARRPVRLIWYQTHADKIEAQRHFAPGTGDKNILIHKVTSCIFRLSR